MKVLYLEEKVFGLILEILLREILGIVVIICVYVLGVFYIEKFILYNKKYFFCMIILGKYLIKKVLIIKFWKKVISKIFGKFLFSK